MPNFACLFHFHCGNAAGSNEHVFPAALGGRRTDRRLICDNCQGWTGKLDEVLPAQLRYLNLHLGVVGDHSARPARISIPDGDSGRLLLLDEKMNIEAQGKHLVAEHTDETGYTVRRYNFLSKAEERRVLNELRAEGIKVEVLSRESTPILRTKPLTSNLEFGGVKGMRAVARIALNFLAIQEPEIARAAMLEPLKRWILADESTVDDFVNFGGVLPSAFRVANQYEFGQRVIVGLDPDDGVFARVSFFDTYELAIRLGPAVLGPRRYHVWDLDPLARHEQPGVDRLARNFEGILDHSPTVLGEFAATSGEVFDRVQSGSERILDVARGRIDRERAERLSQELVRLANVPPEHRQDRLKRLLRGELQCATNLVVRVASVVDDHVRASGYSWAAHYLHALMDAEVSDFIVPVSEGVLDEFSSVLLTAIERNDLTDEQVHELLFGMTGLTAANKILFRKLASMRIWYKDEDAQGSAPA